jgi:hypothetical protein
MRSALFLTPSIGLESAQVVINLSSEAAPQPARQFKQFNEIVKSFADCQQECLSGWQVSVKRVGRRWAKRACVQLGAGMKAYRARAIIIRAGICTLRLIPATGRAARSGSGEFRAVTQIFLRC